MTHPTTTNPKLTCPHCHQAIPQPSGIVADELRCEVRYNGLVVYIQPQEFQLFAFLLERIGRVVTKEGILDGLYSLLPCDDDVPDIKIIDVFVCKLRKKLKPLGLELKTHWGRGYSLELPGSVSRVEQTLNATVSGNGAVSFR